MPNLSDDQSRYGSAVAFIYIFNVIVGTGSLAMPASFGDAGWLVSIIVVTMICLTSFISLTFVIESMSIANFICKSGTCLTATVNAEPLADDDQSISSSNSQNIESTPLISNYDLASQRSATTRDDSHLFDITEKMELGHMATILFKKEHLKYFYLCIALYLYGDMTIYSTAISKSLRDVTCTYDNCTKIELDSNDLCWENMSMNREQVYRIYLILLAIILPFFNLHTKYLQFLTTVFRWTAFSIMIALASVSLAQNKGEGSPPKSNLIKLPNLFGICVYSFMCHHSVPRLITPLKNKKHLYRLLSLDYLVILIFYLFLSLTGVFTFSQVQDVYTLNFQKPRCETNLTLIAKSNVPESRILEIFLPLFPVFTLSTNFPIIALTLANNLKAVLFKETISNSRSNLTSDSTFIRLLFPLLVFVPPILISFFSENVELIVGVTGSYGGAIIQYLIPLFLVYNARKTLYRIENGQEQLSLRSVDNLDNSFASSINVPRRYLNKSLFVKNFQSLFKGKFWFGFLLIWSLVSLILVTIDRFIQLKEIIM